MYKKKKKSKAQLTVQTMHFIQYRAFHKKTLSTERKIALS